MKKVFLSLFVAAALTFGLQSCGGDDKDCTTEGCPSGQTCVNGSCQTVAATCDVCGTYNNTATGYMKIANGAVLDTTWVAGVNPVSLPATFSETSGTYKLTVNLSSISSLLSTPIAVDGSYNATTKVFTVTDFPYSVAGIASVLVNGTADFSTANAVSGSLLITAPAGATVPVDGQLDFSGTKQ